MRALHLESHSNMYLATNTTPNTIIHQSRDTLTTTTTRAPSTTRIIHLRLGMRHPPRR